MINLTQARFLGFEAAKARKAKHCTYQNLRERQAWYEGYEDYETREARFAKSSVQDFLAKAVRDQVMAELKEYLK